MQNYVRIQPPSFDLWCYEYSSKRFGKKTTIGAFVQIFHVTSINIHRRSPGATRQRQGVERAKTLVIFVNSIKTSRAIKYLVVDHTKKWCIRKRCKIMRRCTTPPLICNAGKIHRGVVENRWNPSFFTDFSQRFDRFVPCPKSKDQKVDLCVILQLFCIFHF